MPGTGSSSGSSSANRAHSSQQPTYATPTQCKRAKPQPMCCMPDAYTGNLQPLTSTRQMGHGRGPPPAPASQRWAHGMHRAQCPQGMQTAARAASSHATHSPPLGACGGGGGWSALGRVGAEPDDARLCCAGSGCAATAAAAPPPVFCRAEGPTPAARSAAPACGCAGCTRGAECMLPPASGWPTPNCASSAPRSPGPSAGLSEAVLMLSAGSVGTAPTSCALLHSRALLPRGCSQLSGAVHAGQRWVGVWAPSSPWHLPLSHLRGSRRRNSRLGGRPLPRLALLALPLPLGAVPGGLGRRCVPLQGGRLLLLPQQRLCRRLRCGLPLPKVVRTWLRLLLGPLLLAAPAPPARLAARLLWRAGRQLLCIPAGAS